MNNNQEIENILKDDLLIINKQLEYFISEKDSTHVIRKQQQRGINTNMILIALNYGYKKRSYQNWSYTLRDKDLLNSKYEKYLSKLRGLTIIGDWKDEVFIIITCFWDYTIKSRKRY